MMLLVALAAATSVTAAAPLTVADAVARAREVSPQVARLRALETAASASVREAGSDRYPTLDLLAGYTRNSNLPIVALPLPDGSERVIFANIPDNWATRVQASYPLYTGGRTSSTIDAATRNRDAAASDTAAGVSDVVYETQVAYWSLAFARESERVLGETLTSYDAHIRDAENRRAVGLAAEDEVLAVRVERDRAELARLEAEKAALTAEENLRRLLDLPPDDPVALADALPREAPPDEDLESLVGAALAARPERKALEARKQAAESRASVEHSRRLPQIAASGTYDYADPNRQILPLQDIWRSSWAVSLNASFRAFDGGKAKAATARADAEAEALARQIDDFDRRVRLDVASRALEVRTARASVAVAEHQVDAARESARITRDRYREGVAPSSELLDAETRQLRAELEVASARARTATAVASLDRAVGR